MNREACCPFGPDRVKLISGIDFNRSSKSTAPISSICFFVIIILLIPFFENWDEFGTSLIISIQGILFLLSHSHEKLLFCLSA